MGFSDRKHKCIKMFKFRDGENGKRNGIHPYWAVHPLIKDVVQAIDVNWGVDSDFGSVCSHRIYLKGIKTDTIAIDVQLLTYAEIKAIHESREQKAVASK